MGLHSDLWSGAQAAGGSGGEGARRVGDQESKDGVEEVVVGLRRQRCRMCRL